MKEPCHCGRPALLRLTATAYDMTVLDEVVLCRACLDTAGGRWFCEALSLAIPDHIPTRMRVVK